MSKICKLALFLLSFLTLFSFSSKYASAIYDPLSVPNNSFGIHITNIQDLEDAAKLVNSGGGDWGYVTLIVTENNRSVNLWQEVFNKMRRLHLIPIIRVATKEENGNWKRPILGEIDSWISFFNSLNWVIKNRYVVIGNEVNSAKEWGGEVNPKEYALYLKEFSQKLKKENPDYFIMLAGLDASLPTAKGSLDERTYLVKMVTSEPDLFELIDGWASHSYPNPNFSASEYASGKGSIRTFEWEIAFLKNLGLTKDLPIFITETGWAHKVSGNSQTAKFLDEEELSLKFTRAFSGAWSGKNIAAVTPFILNYEFPPFDMFSWKNNGKFNNLYTDMQALKKEKSEPIQEDRGEISRIFVPAINLLGNSFTGLFFVENDGQTIWEKDKLEIISTEGEKFEIVKISLSSYEPGGSGFIVFKGNPPQRQGSFQKEIYLTHNGKGITENAAFKILSLATLRMKVNLFLDSILSLWHSDK